MELTQEEKIKLAEKWKRVKENIIRLGNAFKVMWQKLINTIKKYWSSLRLYLLKTPEGRKILCKVITNNNWRKNHGLPLIRRRIVYSE